MTDPEDLHPYDGRERSYHHDDAELQAQLRGRALVARLLSLPAPPPAHGLRYSLSFYSGGTGVLDRLHIAMPCAPGEAETIATRAGMLAAEALLAAAADQEQREALAWLVLDDAHPELEAALVAFIEGKRLSFQPPPQVGLRAWFWPGSDVNAWSLVYEVAGELGFIAYDQG